MKNKNIWLLPTDKPSRLCLWFNKLELSKEFLNIKRNKQNIYITSDEEITPGYWLDLADNSIVKTTSEDLIKFKSYDKIQFKKIILTTDEDLIKEGVQAIDDEFLEWFVKNPSCEEVVAESFVNGNIERIYEIIIPKEESEQQIPQFGTKRFNDLCSNFFGGKSKQSIKNQNALDDKEIENLSNDWEGMKQQVSSKQETLEEVKDLEYWKNNAKEDYMKVPISVLRYISELEEQNKNLCSGFFDGSSKREFGFKVENGKRTETFFSKEKPKQETLEEASKKNAFYELEKNYKQTKESFKLACKRSFLRGANWQAERMYSEEDMKKYGEFCVAKFNKFNSVSLPNNYFEQFKKK